MNDFILDSLISFTTSENKRERETWDSPELEASRSIRDQPTLLHFLPWIFTVTGPEKYFEKLNEVPFQKDFSSKRLYMIENTEFLGFRQVSSDRRNPNK
jgi:hypothetical protein